ncbi:hypothetical protein KI387_008868, partial [Taxus chinensis]
VEEGRAAGGTVIGGHAGQGAEWTGGRGAAGVTEAHGEGRPGQRVAGAAGTGGSGGRGQRRLE